MVLGTPVATINLFEVPKQVGEAGLLFDPYSVEDMADKIYKIWQDDKLREKMIKLGYEKTKEMTSENYSKKWEQVLKEVFKKYEQQ
jgi:glycosyltransferase involved in cell wall biosynthesis